ncbi:MAG: DUF1295 domain-containing protein [Micropruina sp.]
MTAQGRQSLIAVAAVTLLGVGLAWAGSQGGAMTSGIPVFALVVAVSFVIQWVVFIPSFRQQTEHYFDLTGSGSYLVAIVLALALSGTPDARSLLLAVLVAVWAVRLGTFLFRRVRRTGKDSRFDELKPDFFRFLSVWTIQGLWVSLTLASALAAITSTRRVGLDAFALVGAMLWVVGFGLEATADAQKGAFKADPANQGRFIRDGLWAWSRHPNYAGEILLWVGVTIIALPVLSGWQWVTLISPLFVTLLLTKVSGVPLLERKADATWGGQADYEAYKANTPVLIPRPPRR